mgnify:CR=1 FL=1
MSLNAMLCKPEDLVRGFGKQPEGMRLNLRPTEGCHHPVFSISISSVQILELLRMKEQTLTVEFAQSPQYVKDMDCHCDAAMGGHMRFSQCKNLATHMAESSSGGDPNGNKLLACSEHATYYKRTGYFKKIRKLPSFDDNDSE